MTISTTLIDLEYEARFFEELLENDAPEDRIDAEFDRLCMVHFGFTKTELTGQVPQTVLDGIDDWHFEEIMALGERHGFDFEEKRGDKNVTRTFGYEYILSMTGYFAEMLIAKECGYFPTTPDEMAKVKLERQAKAFQAEIARQRQRPRQEDRERAQVFGAGSRTLRAGTVTAPVGSKKEGRNRIVPVQVIPSRRVPPSKP